MYGLTRGTMTLIGAGAAGFLLWLASQTNVDGRGGYWSYVGLLAGAGLVMALSQLLGGWTKWGWPRVTGGVFLLGFLPALAVGGIVLLYAQPDRARGAGLAADLGLDGLAQDLTAVLPAIAFGLGLLLGLTFDTTGPRRGMERVDATDEREARPPGYVGPVPLDDTRTADEPVAAERAHGTEGARDPVREPVAARVDRDGDGVDDRAEGRANVRGFDAGDDR